MSFEPPLHTKIKQEDNDISAVINLDLDKSPADLVYEWNAKVRLKFKNYIIVDSEESLDSLMKWYIQTLKEEALDFEDYKSLKSLTANHIQFFKLYFDELNCCFVDNYLDNMEEILAFYVNLEVKCLPLSQSDGRKRAYKKQLSLLCRRVISMLHLYLLSREDRICHVIIKMKLSEEKKDFFNLLYGNFLTQEPKEKSDMEFCRAYILYQKWKTILKPEEWSKMDEIMYKIHERTPECLKVNPVLKQILFPRSDSILDTLTHICQKHVTMTEEYFKYIKSNNNQEDNVLDTSITSVTIQDNIIPDWGDTEDQELDKAYEDYVKSMSTIHLDDDDCQIVRVSSVQNDHETDVIHEIVDDDIEIIYFMKKEEPKTVTRENKKSSTSTPSFLQSITIPASRDVSMEAVSSSTNKVAKTNEMFEKSRNNTDVEVADSPTSISLAKPSKDCRTNLTTSVAQTGFHSGEVVCLDEDLTEETIDIPTGSNSRTKSVVSIETQTDDWHMDDNQNKLSALEKHAEQNGICRSYYYYGLVTPPSDQPLDDPGPTVSESAPYANVYTNFARTHSPDENDSLSKVPESDSLSSSLEDEIDASPANMSVKVNETLTSQDKPDKCPTDTEFMQEVESNTEKLQDRHKFENSCPIPSGAISAIDRQQPGCSGDYELNNGLVENCLEDSPVNNTTSISINTNGYCGSNVDYLDDDINSRAPLKNGQSVPITSTGIPCTSPDFLITPQGFPSFDSQNKLVDFSNTSADVTSTSTDAQDFSETEVEVSSSNLEEAEEDEISIEDHTLVSNGEDFLYIVDEALPISASVNICTEESSHSCADDNDNGGEAEKERLGPVLPHRELDVNAGKIDVNSHENKRNGEVNPSRIRYTSVGKVIKSPIDDFSKFEEKLHTRWSQLKDTHDLDKIFSGSVSKITKVCDNRDASFDLFSTKLSPVRKGSGSQVIINSTQNEVTSPAYEGIDDFKIYFERSKSMIEVPSMQNRTLQVEEEIGNVNAEKNIVHCAVDKTKVDSLEKSQDTTSRSTTNNLSDPDVSDSQRTKRRTGKRVHITEIIMESNNSVPQLSTGNTEHNLQGVLRKERSTWRFPKSMMNLKSLSQYKVEPNDSCIQSVPCVVMERLSDAEIAQWLKVSELSRKVRLEKQQLQLASQQTIRVNYDKYLSKDEVRSVPQSFGQWRRSTLQNKSKRLDEGLQEIPYTEKKTGKRKRQSSVTASNFKTTKKGPGRPGQSFRKSWCQGSNTKEKKAKKDYEALISSGY